MSTNNFNLEDTNNNSNLLTTAATNVQINESMAKKYKYASKHLEKLTDDWKRKGQTNKYKASIHLSVQKKIKALTNHLVKLEQKKNSNQDNLDFLKGKERDYRIGIKATNDLQKLITDHYIPVEIMTLKLNNKEFTITDLLEGPTESNTNVMKGYKQELTRLKNLYETQSSEIITKNNKIQEEFTNSIRDYLQKIIEFKATKLDDVEKNLLDILKNSDLILGKLQKKLVELINSISNENINNNLKKSSTKKPEIKLSTKSNVQVTNQDLIHKLYENYQQIKTNTNLVKNEQRKIKMINDNLLYSKKTNKNNPEKHEKQIVDLVRNYFGAEQVKSFKTALNKYTVNETKYPINKTNIINTSILSSWQYYSTLLDFRIKKAQAIFEEVIKMCKKLSVLIEKLEKSKISINKVPAKNLSTTKEYLKSIRKQYADMAELTMNNCLKMNKKLQSLNIATYLEAINQHLSQNGSLGTHPDSPSISRTSSTNSFVTLENLGTGPNSNTEIMVPPQEIVTKNEQTVEGIASVISPNNSKKISNGNIKPENLNEFIFEHLFTTKERKQLLDSTANSLLKKKGRNTKSLLNQGGKLVNLNKKSEDELKKNTNVLKNIIYELESYTENKMENHLKKYPTKKGIFTSSPPQPENKNGYTQNLINAEKSKTSMEDKVRFAFNNKDKLIEYLKKALPQK